MRVLGGILTVLLSCVTIRAAPGGGDPGQAALAESEVKAAYLYNFTKFVQWPAGAASSDEGAFVIVLAGDGPSEAVVERSLAGKKIGDREIVVRQLGSPGDVRDAQIVFIGSSGRRRMAEIAEVARGLPVLTVTESEDLVKSGCMVNFVLEAQRVRLEIDIDRVEQASLRMSSKLLMLARVRRKGLWEGRS